MKRSFCRIICLFLIMLMLPLFSLTAWADEGSAVLDSLHFDIALQEDGSALIAETREIVFNGYREFTRYRVNNLFTGPRAFSDWQVSIDGTPAAQLDEPDNETRPENTFAVEVNEGENTVSTYFRQRGSGTRTFRISYYVENAVKLYSDVGEFFWNLTGENAISDIGKLTATLTVPESCPAEEFLIWAHGPLNGNFDKQPDGSAYLEVENVAQGTIIDIRCTLPADYFTGGWEQQGEALNAILEKEQELSDSANAKREEEARAQAERDAYWEAYYAEQEMKQAARNAWGEEHPVLSSIQIFCEDLFDAVYYSIPDSPSTAAAILGVCVFVLAAFLGRFRRDPKQFRHAPTQSPQYYRDLPDDRPAPAVDRLVHFYDGKIDVSRQISSTLLELNLKGLVHFQTVDGEVALLLDAQRGEELFPTFASNEPNRSHTPDHQETLWGFLLNAAEGNGRIAMKDLKAFIQSNQETAYHFRRDFVAAVTREHEERVKTQRVKRPLFGRSKRSLLFPVVVGVLVMLVCVGASLYDGITFGVSVVYGVIGLLAAALLLVVFCLGRRFGQGRCVILDQQSEDALALWQAFGRFLDDFTTFEEKELPEFFVWREYMVYAVALGRGQKVIQALHLKYPESFSTEMPGAEDEMIRLLREMEFYRMMESIGRDVADARQPSYSASNSDSNWSDGSGGGGGFSDFDGGSDSGSGGDFID